MSSRALRARRRQHSDACGHDTPLVGRVYTGDSSSARGKDVRGCSGASDGTRDDDLRLAEPGLMAYLERSISSMQVFGTYPYSQLVFGRVVPLLQMYGCLLSVGQCVRLLGMLKHCDSSSYKCTNLLVALCAEPWDVPVAFGSHGVCYHGNLGERPALRTTRDRIRRRNREAIVAMSRGMY